MFDSATDCSLQVTEVVIVLYFRNGHSVNELLALASLKHAHTDDIIGAITTSFVSIGQKTFKEHMIAFCADGASVNHGAKEASRQSCQTSARGFWAFGVYHADWS